MSSSLNPHQGVTSLFDAFSELMITMDLDLRIQWANQKAADLVNNAPENLVGQYCYQVTHGRQTPCEDCPVLMTIQREEKQETDKEAPDGRSYNVRSYPLYSQEGSLGGVAVVALDISDRKREEQALRQSEERFHWAMEATQEGVWDWDLTTDEVYYSPAYAAMLGYTRDEVPPYARFWLDHIHPEDEESAFRANKECIENRRKSFEIGFRMLTKNGEVRWILGRGMAVSRDEQGQATRLVGTHADMTQRNQMEAELRQSENFYRTLFEITGSAMFIIEEDTTISLVNSNFEELTGCSKQEVEGKKFATEFLHTHDVPRFMENHYLRRRDPQAAPLNYEMRCLNSNHEVRHGYLSIDMIPETTQSLASLVDITERKHAEQAVRESELQFRTLFIESPVAIYIHNKDTGEIIDANPKAYASYYLSSVKELNSSEWIWMEHPYSYTEAINWITKAAHEGPQQFEWKSRNIYGEVLWQLVRLIPMTINGMERVVATAVDITELKETINALHQSENYYRAIFETSGSAMIIIEQDTTISLINTYFEELSGYTSQEMEGKKSWTEVVHPDDVEWMKENHYLRRQNPEAAQRQYEFRFMNRHGEERSVLLAVDMIPGTSRSIASVIDITQRKRMEEKLKEMSFRDSLTGLYNRNFFEEEMARIGNGRYDPVGIVVCDLDGLKFVNDTLGHQSGDQMLIQTADILRHNFRSSDIIARIGGDEFAVLLTETNPERVEQILRRLRQAVHDHNNAEPELPLSLSMGYALDEGGTVDMQALFCEADNRMYREKIQREGSARSAILHALTVSMEARDFNTENHCNRLQELTASLALSLDLTRDFVNDLSLLTRFHDLGKVGIPDHILFKPGPLSEEEWRQMRQHCEIGHRIASSVPDLEPIADFILKHHERWDGRGYPQGLSGDDIPLPCRILAIVDAYDAMTSDRPYRKAMPREEAIAELQRCAGTQFDPGLVEQFIQIV